MPSEAGDGGRLVLELMTDRLRHRMGLARPRRSRDNADHLRAGGGDRSALFAIEQRRRLHVRLGHRAGRSNRHRVGVGRLDRHRRQPERGFELFGETGQSLIAISMFEDEVVEHELAGIILDEIAGVGRTQFPCNLEVLDQLDLVHTPDQPVHPDHCRHDGHHVAVQAISRRGPAANPQEPESKQVFVRR